MDNSFDIDRDILLGFIEESLDGLAIAEQGLIQLESHPDDMEHINAVFRAVHSLKGNSAFFDLMRVKRLSHKMEDLLDGIRQKKMPCSKKLIDLLLPGLDMLRRMLEQVRNGGPECVDEGPFTVILNQVESYTPESEEAGLFEQINRHLHRVRAQLPGEYRALVDEVLALTVPAGDALPSLKPDTRPAMPEPGTDEPSDPAQEDHPKALKTEKTMRISEGSLDGFLDHVGELLGIEEMLIHAIRMKGNSGQADPALDELKQTVQQFSKLSAALRTGIMDIRKVSPRALMGKVPRLVREIANLTGKQISVITSGEDIPIDKSYADLLDAPLVHMVRNAADHGVELPDERQHAGKNPEGIIRVELAEEEHDIVLTVSDDGKGLNLEALGRKAVELGILADGVSPSEEDIIRLLFMSGVSTAGAVTEISGRGVGMDVVRQSIEGAGGRITVSSLRDKGCVFKVFLPRNVSTKIVDGYLVRSRSGSVYVLPLKSVLEAFALNESQISSVQNKGHIVTRRGMIYPLVNMEERIGCGGVTGDAGKENTLVLIRYAGKTAALAISEVVGVQKIVVKNIEGLPTQNNVFEGAALMGDGRVALVLGDKGLLRLFDDV